MWKINKCRISGINELSKRRINTRKGNKINHRRKRIKISNRIKENGISRRRKENEISHRN